MSDSIRIYPRIDAVFVGLEKIRRLACGRVRLDDLPPRAVLQEDIDAALIIAEAIEQEISNLRFNRDELGNTVGVPLHDLRGRGRGGHVLEMMYGAAEDGSKGQRRFLQRHAGKTLKDAPPASLEGVIKHQNMIANAREVLMMLSGEMSWESSAYAQISERFNEFTNDLADMTLSLLPFFGPIYDVSTGIVGRRLSDGQQLSNFERALRIGFATFGALVSAVAKGARVTASTVKVLKLGRALNLPEHEHRSFVALALAVARMSPEEAALISAMLNTVTKGGRLSSKEILRITRLFRIYNEIGTAAHWIRLGENPRNYKGSIGSFLIIRGAENLKAGEREAIEALTKGLRRPNGLVLPEVRPQDFVPGAKVRQVSGNKHPDLAIGSTLLDIYSPQTKNIDKIIGEIASKSVQASTIVINMDKTGVPAAQLLKDLPRLWGKPEAWGIYRVIVLDSKGLFLSVKRPLKWSFDEIVSGPAAALTREATLKLWDEIEAEAESKTEFR